MKDILRPILELLVVLPGLLLGYFPVKTYLKQSPGRLAAWLFPLMACLCIGSGLACYRLHASTVRVREQPVPRRQRRDHPESAAAAGRTVALPWGLRVL